MYFVVKILWKTLTFVFQEIKNRWVHILVLLPRKSHGWRSLVSMGLQRVRYDWTTELNRGLYKNSSSPEEFYCLYCCCFVWFEWERKSKNLGIHLGRGRWIWMLSSGLKTWRSRVISSWQEPSILRNRGCYWSKTEIDLVCFLRNRVSWGTDHCVQRNFGGRSWE